MNNDGWTVVTEKKKKAPPKKTTDTPAFYGAGASTSTAVSKPSFSSGGGGGISDVGGIKKFTGGNKHTKTVVTAADYDDEEVKVPHDVAIAIVQARQAKGMSQAELAQAINEKATLVKEYETSKAVGNNEVIARMEKVLGTKLPRISKKKRAKK